MSKQRPADESALFDLGPPRNYDDNDDDSYDEQQELASLVAASVKQTRQHINPQSPKSLPARPRTKVPLLKRIFGNRKSVRFMALVSVVFLLLYVITSFSSSSAANENLSSSTVEKKALKGTPRYKCPASVTINKGALPRNETASITIMGNEKLETWVKTFRDREYDRWGHTYNQIKASLTDWKSTRFAPFLKNIQNATIYDSSLGIGLDSLMTLEILKENTKLTGLTIYGNDIRKENVEIARDLMTQFLPDLEGKGGRFCQADSILLHSFVPESAFDVVFTGRIPPLVNPLNLRANEPADLERQYAALCAASTTPSQKRQLDLAQKRQDAWYLKWLLEMIRIAKPGQPVVVEQVSLPLCENLFDFGGVPMSFWNSTSALTKKIQISTLQLQTDTLVPKRYHVFMQKKMQS